jgi:hypothetical protein
VVTIMTNLLQMQHEELKSINSNMRVYELEY